MKPDDLILKTDAALKKVFARVTLVSPYYEMLREIQQDIYKYQNRKEIAVKMQKEGKTIREIAKYLGYKHPGSVTSILPQK